MLIKETTATPIDYLRMAVGREDARFRDEQLECIEAAVRGERLLVVQRTGWGKSIVYFIATRLLRDRGAGATLIVSPLLSLMRNQVGGGGADRVAAGDDQFGEYGGLGVGDCGDATE